MIVDVRDQGRGGGGERVGEDSFSLFKGSAFPAELGYGRFDSPYGGPSPENAIPIKVRGRVLRFLHGSLAGHSVSVRPVLRHRHSWRDASVRIVGADGIVGVGDSRIGAWVDVAIRVGSRGADAGDGGSVLKGSELAVILSNFFGIKGALLGELPCPYVSHDGPCLAPLSPFAW
jgi:hypothetical protein